MAVLNSGPSLDHLVLEAVAGRLRTRSRTLRNNMRVDVIVRMAHRGLLFSGILPWGDHPLIIGRLQGMEEWHNG